MAYSTSSPMDCDHFIKDIMARPGIWKVKHPERRNKYMVKMLWDEISKKYPEHTVDDLKKRWKNLKDTFRKELKRLPQSKPGVPAENFKSGWRYFDSLFFLKEEFGYKSKEPEDPIFCQVESEKYVEASSQSPGSPGSSKSEEEVHEMPVPSGSKRKGEAGDIRSEILKIERKKMKILEEEVAKSNEYMKSDNYHFLMSLLPEMDKLPPLQKMRLRTKISQAVLDEVSITIYDDQQNYQEVQLQEQLNFHQEAPVENVNLVKEEAINMYD